MSEPAVVSPQSGDGDSALQDEDGSSRDKGRPWLAAVVAALPVWATMYLAYVVVTVLAWVNPSPTTWASAVFELSWFRLDARLFADIANHGYAPPAAPGLAALFPLYPLVLRAVDVLLPGDAFEAGLLVSAGALLAMLAVLYRLAATEFDQATARRSLWLVGAFPTAFFLAIGYNESLFLALAIGSIYTMRRGHWWTAGILGGLASLTRSVGILLVVAFVYEYLRQHGSIRRVQHDALAALLIPAGTGVFALYLWRAVGDPLAFSHVQANWTRRMDWPWVDVSNAIQLVIEGLPKLHRLTLYAAFNLGMVLVVAALLILIVFGPWRFRRDQRVFPIVGAAFLLFAISFPVDPDIKPYPLYSAARLVMEAFPIFILLARARPLAKPYACVGLAMQGLLLSHFVLGGWVA